MKVITSISRMQKTALSLKKRGKTIGFVPTMGYLHEGHLSLIKIARKHADVVVASIFVNPKQFGPGEDLASYPRDLNRDKALLRNEGCDILFLPTAKAIYPEGYLTYVNVDKLSEILEGEIRPGHFRGVATIVAKLFNLVQPDVAVFGQKDAQQVVVIKKMVADLNFPVKIIVAPTKRDEKGLALSSRNSYLTPPEKVTACSLFQTLQLARKLIEAGERNSDKIKALLKESFTQYPKAFLEYIAITEAETLKPIDKLEGKVLISVAVKIGKARLIDNISLRAKKEN